MPRIPYATEEELPERVASLLGSYGEMGAEYTPHVSSPTREYSDERSDDPSPLYRVMAHNPPILEAFRRMASVLRAECGLDERRREILILATASAAGAEYEWHQHVRIAREVGVGIEEIRSIADGRSDAFDDDEAALVDYGTALVTGDVTDAHHDALAEQFDERQIVGIGMVAQFYAGLATFIDAFELDVDEPFVGWDLERLDAA